MSQQKWLVFKFGGTSMGSAERIANVASLVVGTLYDAHKTRLYSGRLAVVVSAMSGVTDALIHLTKLALARSPDLEAAWLALKNKHKDTAAKLLQGPAFNNVVLKLEKDFAALWDVLRGISLLCECSERARDYVSGLGEVWSASILAEYIKSLGYGCAFIDARDYLVVEPAHPSPTILWEESHNNFADWKETELDFLVITGFVCKTQQNVPTTLGRNGSDYSAAIFGYLLDAEEIVIWTDVDGVMSADPRRVHDAVVIPELSYQEAIELANFGAKVLHPMTMVPAVLKSIPIRIKNTFNPTFEGSVIKSQSKFSKKFAVKGCTTVDNIAIITLTIRGLQSLQQVSHEVTKILQRENIPIMLGILGSPGNSISFAIPQTYAEIAKKALDKAFATEIQTGAIQACEILDKQAILAIVGDGMIHNIGLSARFFDALAQAGVNIRAIAQGPEERAISVIVDSSQANIALKAAHAGFYLSPQTLAIGLIADETVAPFLLEQLKQSEHLLRHQLHVDLRIYAIIQNNVMALSNHPLENPIEFLEKNGTTADFDKFANALKSIGLPHAVVIDTLQSSATAELYARWLEMGLHIISPNKFGNASSLSHYHLLQQEMRQRERHYLYESMVCDSLPVIETLADLIQTGDTVTHITGSFSGILSEVFCSFAHGMQPQELACKLTQLGFTPAQLFTELLGYTSQQVLVILARELGLSLETTDVKVEPLIKAANSKPLPSLEDILTTLYTTHQEKISEARNTQKGLCYAGNIYATGEARLELMVVDSSSPLAQLKAGDALVAFYTKRYGVRPLIVQGPATRPELTASAIFADLLRLTRYLGSMG